MAVAPPQDWSVEHYLAHEPECTGLLEDASAVGSIPSLNAAPLDHFRDGQLVRFRGMLQDMYDPEYYFKSYEVVDKSSGEASMRCGMYKDGAKCEVNERISLESRKNETSERLTWIVISTPGLNDWAGEKSRPVTGVNSSTVERSDCDRSKRALEEEEDGEAMDCSEQPEPKRERVSQAEAAANDAGTSRATAGEAATPMIVSREHILNFPIPIENGKACMVKTYFDAPYKLNQVLDIVGFLSLDPSLSEIHDSEELKNDLEVQTHNPPASMMPRLHAIKVSAVDEGSKDATGLLQRAASVRGDLRIVLNQLLFGDEIATDYLICHLISSIYQRKDSLALGAFPLNITNFPKACSNFTTELYEILKMIVSKSHYLDITLKNLNDVNLLPKKDYDCNRLTSGILQLSKNTHLVIDETHLKSGKLTPLGKDNYKIIGDLIRFQKLGYDFKVYTIEYETDIPVLILSDTKSFIPCPNQVAIKPDPEIVKIYPEVIEAAKHYLRDEGRLNNIREYINDLKHAKFDFTEDSSKVIQDDFVRLRQTDRHFSADDLHSLMVLSRLMALSHGCGSFSPEMWKRSLDMEQERKRRLPARRN